MTEAKSVKRQAAARDRLEIEHWRALRALRRIIDLFEKSPPKSPALQRAFTAARASLRRLDRAHVDSLLAVFGTIPGGHPTNEETARLYRDAEGLKR